MAVTKQVYTLTPTWTAAQLASAFESAFIDAGLMTAWHDSFLSGSVENRILAVDYGTGTYSVTYYWFMFTTTGAFYAPCTGWNTGSDIPSGTQYLDFYSTTNNATTNHVALGPALNTATTVLVTRYSSAITSGYAWFTIRIGSNFGVFHIVRAGAPIQSWIDLDKGYFPGMTFVTSTLSTHQTYTRFIDPYFLRRHAIWGSQLANSTNLSQYIRSVNFAIFNSPGLHMTVGNNSQNNLSTDNTAIVLPAHFSAVNPAYGANVNPVYTGLALNAYINEVCPADFGIGGTSNAVAIVQADKLIVTAGVEEWEYLTVASGGSTVNNQAGLLARVV